MEQPLTQSSSCAQKNELGWTQMRRMTLRKKKSQFTKKTPTCPTTYTSYSACLRVLKRGQNHLKTVWWVSEGRDSEVVEKNTVGRTGSAACRRGRCTQEAGRYALGLCESTQAPWRREEGRMKTRTMCGRLPESQDDESNRDCGWATDLTIIAS